MQLETSMMILLGLTVALVASYAFGSIWNRRIQRSFWKALRGVLKRYSRKVRFKSLGSSGFKVAFRTSSGPLSKVEVSLVLLAREMPIYLLTAYALGRRDRIVVKANLARKPGFRLEVLGKKTKAAREVELRKEVFKPVEVGRLSRYMEVRSDKPERALKALSGDVLEALVALKDKLVRFSVSRREPHVIITCLRDESKLDVVFRLLESIAHAVCEAEELTRGRRGRR